MAGADVHAESLPSPGLGGTRVGWPRHQARVAEIISWADVGLALPTTQLSPGYLSAPNGRGRWGGRGHARHSAYEILVLEAPKRFGVDAISAYI